MQKIMDVIAADAWAITQEAFAQVIAIAERRNEATPEALEAYRADHVPQSERLEMRDGVAIVHANGPLFRYANLFTAISGATSYDAMRTDFQVALDDPDVKAILLSFDTPGGHVNGVNEMAKAIRDARGVKPVVAYVGGMAASAGYWLASQADRIVIDETATLGSIGVRAAFPAQGADGSVEFISSQSPGKRLDVTSDAGRARIQSRVDALADVFVEAVASGRGVTPETVIAKFGGGDVLVGKAAVAAGMADEIGTFEGVLSQLAGRSTPPSSRRTSLMAIDHEAAIAAARAEATTAERTRISAIMALDEARDRDALARHIAFSTDMSADDARGMLAAAPVASTPAPAAPQPAPAQPAPARAGDAPGGLVLAPGAQAPNAADKADEMWANTIAAQNKRNGF